MYIIKYINNSWSGLEDVPYAEDYILSKTKLLLTRKIILMRLSAKTFLLVICIGTLLYNLQKPIDWFTSILLHIWIRSTWACIFGSNISSTRFILINQALSILKRQKFLDCVPIATKAHKQGLIKMKQE